MYLLDGQLARSFSRAGPFPGQVCQVSFEGGPWPLFSVLKQAPAGHAPHGQTIIPSLCRVMRPAVRPVSVPLKKKLTPIR